MRAECPGRCGAVKRAVGETAPFRHHPGASYRAIRVGYGSGVRVGDYTNMACMKGSAGGRSGRPRSQGSGIREPQAGPSEQVGRREAAEALARSAAWGRELARLLDSDTLVPGVTSGRLRPEIAAIAVPATTHDRNMSGDDFALTAGWGHYGTGGAVMPGQGRIVERPFTPEERAALGDTLPVLGKTTFNVHLNARAFWRNVPAAVWGYKLGGYQILKKWLSYRERAILDRPLTPAEVQHFTDVARRIAAIA